MPTLTRNEMHINIDLAIKKLDSYPITILDPLVKDVFINRTIDEFINFTVNKSNFPDENKRVPFRILTYGDILSKYSSLYTLIKIDDTLLPLTPIDTNFYQYTLPSDLFKYEASFTNVRPIDCITYPSATALTATLGSGAGNVDDGKHYYFVTFIYSTLETDINGINVDDATVIAKGVNGKIELTAIPLGLTGCTARKIYRTKVGEAWYNGRLLTTISDNVTTIYTDNVADANLGALYSGNSNDTQLPNLLLDDYDIISFNNNPFGGGRQYIGTILETTGLRLYHLGRYAISKVGIIYIKKPAILSSTITQCDLPELVHTTIVENTIKYIMTTVNNGSFDQIASQVKR